MSRRPRNRFAVRPIALAAAWVLAFAAPSFATDDPPANSPLPSDPVFRALRVDGSVATGKIRQLGPGDRLVLVTDEAEADIPIRDLVKLSRADDPPASPPEGTLVLFPGGDRLKAGIGVSTETTLEVTAPLLGDAPLAVPLDAALGLVLAPAPDPSAQEALVARTRDQARDSEVFWLANGDRLQGGFLGLSPQKATLQRDGDPVAIDRAAVVAVGFDPAVVAYPEPKGHFLELAFRDGSRLGVTGCRVEQGQILATARFGTPLRMPLGELSRVHVLGGPVAYLSDRKEALAEYVGYLGTHPSRYGRNQTLEGQALRLAGQPYDRGLATQSRTLLAYRLAPGDDRFQATIGLDDRAGPLGSVVFRVLVDGKERYASPPMTARDTPREVDLPLDGARILILATEFGERGDVQDQADWAEARLIRKSDPETSR